MSAKFEMAVMLTNLIVTAIFVTEITTK